MTVELTHVQETALTAAVIAERAYIAANAEAERCRNARNDALRQAIRVGVKSADVARRVSLTPSRIGQIRRSS